MMTAGRFLVHGKERYAVIEGEEAHLIDGDIFGNIKKTGEVYRIPELSMLCPVKPNKVIGIYSNYRSSVLAAGSDIPKEPPMFFKASSSVIGHGDNIVVPKIVTEVAYEAELALVIKRKAKNVKAEDAGAYILGYTGANDVTAKNFLGDGPWAKAKAFDTFQPLGKYLIITRDLADVSVTFKLNGVVRQCANSKDFIFSPEEIVEYMSSMMTLEAGDVILTGTPSGAGILKHGDIAEVIVGDAGSLVNSLEYI